MSRSVEKEVQNFGRYIQEAGKKYKTKELCKNAWKIMPSNGQDTHLPNGKTIALTILGVTHGNELAGLAVVNEFLAHLVAGTFELQIPIAVALSNPEAALQNKRFLDKDLNRSFSNSDTETHEGKRARELESFLKDTHRLLDFHQTMRPSEMPFFIFPYTKAGYEFARGIDPRRAIVTHWGDSFSAEGGCTDEYVNSVGGIGISYELGQNGFDPGQIGLGVQGALWAHQSVTNQLRGKSVFRSNFTESTGPIFAWEKIVSFPEKGLPILDDGWNNFMAVEKGQKIGVIDGEDILAEATGKMIFPKYLKPGADMSKRPTELYRVMKEISVEDLPAG